LVLLTVLDEPQYLDELIKPSKMGENSGGFEKPLMPSKEITVYFPPPESFSMRLRRRTLIILQSHFNSFTYSRDSGIRPQRCYGSPCSVNRRIVPREMPVQPDPDDTTMCTPVLHLGLWKSILEILLPKLGGTVGIPLMTFTPAFAFEVARPT